MLPCPIPRIDDRHVGCIRRFLGRSDARMADHDTIGILCHGAGRIGYGRV